ncbi:prolyl endopeptidase isoform X2 [Bactrocera dorsalis]|uniref:Prolyl endopeptidase n=1 Tax=Bactrocera dorsalis TaxID=27457 RepID=A0ABM3KAD8_BACDO|nr:prolyl endopeptidase isoform X2 [Bactrocera dorsalis]
MCRSFGHAGFAGYYLRLAGLCFLRRGYSNLINKMEYPIARKDFSYVDKFHGVELFDVYRWLEDPNADETQIFIEKQNKISRKFIEEGSDRYRIEKKLTKLWNYPKYSCPTKHGDYYYFYVNTGLQNHNVLFQQKHLVDEPKVFLDPNTWSEDGTIALSQKSFSEDGTYMAYGISENGSDWLKIKIRNVISGGDLKETLEKVKFSEISWTLDNKGFFYAKYDQDESADGAEVKQNENQKLYYHYVGNQQNEDILVAEFPEEPSWRIQAVVSDCGRYLVMPIVKGCRDNLLYYIDLNESDKIQSGLNVIKVIDKFEYDYEYITNIGPKMYFRTNKNSPNYRIVIIDLENPGEENWETIIPEQESDVLDWGKCVDSDKLLLCYMQDVKSVLQANCIKTGKLVKKFSLDIGTVVAVSGKKKYSEIFFNFSSFLNPGTIYQYDFGLPNKDLQIFREIKLQLDGFSQYDYEIKQIFYNSKDGTKIPMFIIRKKGEVISPQPCLLYGYGGFNISLQPSFSATGLMFMDTFDGILAYPNLRGGGEYGEKWHNAGRLLNKQNVFDDFQASAEYLINNKYTTRDRLVIQGGSNGGLLVGACINQRPDLFGAAVAQVGVMDMLRFHKFTIGHAWCSDYGDPIEKEHFENLLKYSPLHNVHFPNKKCEQYPSTLILTADHDDRVSPLHSLKFVAALQDAVRNSAQENPILLRVYSKAGHGAGKPTSKRIEESADILTFLRKTINVDVVNL